MEREAKMRAIVRRAKRTNDRECNPEADDNELKFDSSDLVAEQKLTAERPMWALTEQQADKATEHIGVEGDELLEFANALDFDKYINDSEVSCLIENVRARIVELEAKAEVQTRRSESHAGTGIISNFEGNDPLVATHQASGASTDAEDDIMSVARSVLESDVGKAFGSIHSQKSLAAVAERASKSAFQERAQDCIHEEAVPPPLVSKHTDDAGSRLDGKHSVSNLPYMHRNPAV
mmetsp:Transcript_33826/g.104739  ORF Transcript_33826/g.104739 Transcript_33826/m.104739 type:complete len:235 (-) Transcript_33826:260-964(-)